MSAITPPTCAVILCGGKGTRLRKVIRGKPKPMAPIAGAPFLDYLIAYLSRAGVRTIILCTGYKSGVIESRYRSRGNAAEIIISREDRPLGTAGAIKHAAKSITSDPFLVLNGDSICAADLSRLLTFHLKKKARASLVLTENTGRSDVGAVVTDNSGRVVKFSEKSGRGDFMNAGIYVLNKEVLELIPKGRKCSLEYELFPELKDFYGFKSRAALLDIGTPERYALAGKILAKKKKAGR
jgi:D-glycero-alpha-D-manno-heptose 1-phosphate guanylyltransferase